LNKRKERKTNKSREELKRKKRKSPYKNKIALPIKGIYLNQYEWRKV
jgi:hypothetical protein